MQELSIQSQLKPIPTLIYSRSQIKVPVSLAITLEGRRALFAIFCVAEEQGTQ